MGPPQCEMLTLPTLSMEREFPARVFNEKTWQNLINTIYYYKNNDVYNIYLQTSRSTKLTNHSAPFTLDNSVE